MKVAPTTIPIIIAVLEVPVDGLSVVEGVTGTKVAETDSRGPSPAAVNPVASAPDEIAALT